MSLSHSNRCTLNDCMEKFVTGQKVSGWKCPKCQTPRDATKKFDFVKLLRRRDPLEPLRRERRMVGKVQHRHGFPPHGIQLEAVPRRGEHEGNRDEQYPWYKYDDQTVTEVSPSQVKSQNTSAYLLFYTSFPNTIM